MAADAKLAGNSTDAAFWPMTAPVLSLAFKLPKLGSLTFRLAFRLDGDVSCSQPTTLDCRKLGAVKILRDFGKLRRANVGGAGV